MIQRAWFINAVLMVIVVFLALKVYGVWSDGYGVSHKAGFQGSKKPIRQKRMLKGNVPAESSYGVIVSKNLFSPDRMEPVAESLRNETRETKLPGKKIYLYGVVLSDDYKLALITNPVRGKGDRKDIWVHVGDKVDDLKVIEILKDRILLAKGLKEYEISLYDKNKPKRRGISTSGKKPTVVVADARKEEKRTQGKGSQGKKSVEEVESDKGKYRIIDTPFGKIKRRIK